jgi:hypothetical protein
MSAKTPVMAWLTSAQVLRWGFFIAYGFALFVGVALILIFSRQPAPGSKDERESPAVSFTAERELPANRLLQPGDLAALPGGRPRYLKHMAKKDEKIEIGDLSTIPTITVKPGKLPVAFSVESAMVTSGAINAGISVHVCRGPKALVESGEVQAVLCPATDEPCIALTDIPADKASALAEASQASMPATLKVMGSQCQ